MPDPHDSPSDRDLLGNPPPKGKRSWAHRRTEPRPLALMWTLFLLAATLLVFLSAGALGAVTPDNYRPAARTLMLLVFGGVTVLWPMLRLSQKPPRQRIALAMLSDAGVLLIPATAVAMPQVLLADWPPQTVGVLLVALCGWTLLTAGVLAAALRAVARNPRSRTAWMVVFLLLGAGAPALGAIAPPGDPHDDRVHVLALCSPWTAPFELTPRREWTGALTRPRAGHWGGAWTTLVLGAGVWGGAYAVERRGRDG